MEEKDNLIVKISTELALMIIEFTEQLEEKKKFVVAKQLLRSGTSVGANIREAQQSESKADFIHKMKIASKEANETEYWFVLCIESKSYPTPSSEIKDKLNHTQKTLSKIIASAKSKA